MSRDKVSEVVLETTTPPHVIVVSVYYEIGGMSFFQGVEKPRGYYLSVGPEKHEYEDLPDGRRLKTRSFTAFSAPTVLLFDVKRKSQKEAVKAHTQAQARIKPLLDQVLQKTGLKLKENE